MMKQIYTIIIQYHDFILNPIITERLFHGIIVLTVLSISVRSVRKTLVIVNVDQCYSPQEAGQNWEAGVFSGVR
jgi:hypothetical protein